MSEKKNLESNKSYNTILSRRGFSISKDEFTDKELKSIKKDLTVTPISHINYGPSAPSFKIYKESKKRLYVPKSYGIQNFGNPVINKIKNADVEDINLDFKGSMREKQLPVINTFLKECDNTGGGIVCLPCGFGKTVIGLNILSQLKKKNFSCMSQRIFTESMERKN